MIRLGAELAQQLVREPRPQRRANRLATAGRCSGIAHFQLPGESATKQHASNVFDISPEFLKLLGLPIVAGRDLALTDGDDAVLVNQALAATLWPGENPLGQIIIDGTERRVVGVVKDASMDRLDRVDLTMFRFIAPRALPVMLMRPAAPALTRTVAALSPYRFARDRSRRLHAGNTTANSAACRWSPRSRRFSLIALVLAGVGVFGVFAYIVEQRTREIGIRRRSARRGECDDAHAPRQLASLVAGLVIGFVVSVGVARILASELYGASTFDPLVFGGTALLVAVAGVAAAYVPARRAARVDPAMALRNE
jgi:hypothetical protein